MKRKIALIAWAVSIAFLALASGSIWKSVQLTAEVGAGIVTVSGFDVYPIAGALTLLQIASLAVVLLVAETPGKFVLAITSITSITMFIFAVSDWSNQTLRASNLVISEVIGISGEAGQEQFVASAEVSLWPVLYLLALVANSVILLLATVSPLGAGKRQTESSKDEDTDDLWESQKT